jgi:cell division protease FtsH
MMKLSVSAELIWDIAANEAYIKNFEAIEPEHFLLVILKFPGFEDDDIKDFKKGFIKDHLNEMKSVMSFVEEKSMNHIDIINQIDGLNGKYSHENNLMHRSDACKKMFESVNLSLREENRDTAKVIDFLKYLYAIQPFTIIKNIFQTVQPEREEVKNQNLLNNINSIKSQLLEKVYGQDNAVKTFTEGLYNAEMHSLFSDKKTPRAVFVFAGPPGVGKTFLAETFAELKDRHCERFDMSGFAERHQHEELIGLAKGYKEAREGLLTSLVIKKPNAILIFDEIEKSHINTIHLFLQILDSGELEDKYTLKKVSFKGTIIIFTTNVGKSLYDNPNISQLTKFHSKTIVNALENEINPNTGLPFFPQAICSRLSSGYVILFNHLKITDLLNIVDFELKIISKGFKSQFGVEIEFDNLLPYILILKEGVKRDARTISSQVKKFFSNEIRKIESYLKINDLIKGLSEYKKVSFIADVDLKQFEVDDNGIKIFTIPKNPSVLMLTDEVVFEHYKENIHGVKWYFGENQDEILDLLREKEIDFVLIDIWLNKTNVNSSGTYIDFAVAPVASRKFDFGRNMLQMINTKVPDIAVYLFSVGNIDDNKHIDLIEACILEGGAKGILTSEFIDKSRLNWKTKIELFKENLLNEWNKIYLERIVNKLGREQKVISVETAPKKNTSNKTLYVRIRNPKLTRALQASDIGEVLNDIDRPEITFKDVFGAESAKKELQFFIEYLKNPRKYLTSYVKPSRGIILYGPPGTGKTLLAKAFAGETNLAFLHASSTSFITRYQGSGPENIRSLFQRARNNAPSVIFIDEIDAIGKTRTGSEFKRAEENTLNALLTEMDGFQSISQKNPVFIIAATNLNINITDSTGSAIDPALIRRFSKSIFIDLPDKKARNEYLHFRLSNRKRSEISKNTINNIVDRSSGMSFADLESLIENADRDSIINHSVLNDAYILQAFENRFGDQVLYEKTDIEKIAYHEAGHTIMYWLTGKVASYVTIISRSSFGGYMAFESEDIEQKMLTKKQLLDKVCVSLAGRAAEQIFYGEEELTTSASSDLEHATGIILKMLSRFGLYKEFALLSQKELDKFHISENGEFHSKMILQANQIMNEQYEKTLNLLQQNKSLLENLAQELNENEKLTGEELKKFFDEVVR